MKFKTTVIALTLGVSLSSTAAFANGFGQFQSGFQLPSGFEVFAGTANQSNYFSEFTGDVPATTDFSEFQNVTSTPQRGPVFDLTGVEAGSPSEVPSGFESGIFTFQGF